MPTHKQFLYKGKPAQLIVDSQSCNQFVMESVKVSDMPDGALCRLFGTFAFMDETNRNARSYDFENYFAQVQSLQPKIKAKRLLGELEHCKRRTVKYANVSHRIDSIEWNPKRKAFEGWITIFNTPSGQTAYAIVSAGSPLFISSRAIGVVNPQTHKVTILKLITFDLVAEPGFYDAEFSMASTEEQLRKAAIAVNESKELLFVNESDEDDELNSNALMLQLVGLAKSGMLQKLFPDALKDASKLEELQAELVTEAFEDEDNLNQKHITTMKQNTTNFVAAYNDMSIQRDPKDLAKIEAMLDSVGCNYESDVTLAVAYEALSTEQQQEINKLLNIEFVVEATEAEIADKWNAMSIEDRAFYLYNIHQSQFKDAQFDETQTALLNKKHDELTDNEKTFVVNRFAFIDEGDINLDSNLNIDYLSACWSSMNPADRFELLDNAGIKDADKLNDVENFASIEKSAQVEIAKAFVAAGKAQEDLVIDEAESDGIAKVWNEADDDKRAEICKQALMNDDEEAACKGKKFEELDAKLQKLVETGISLLDESHEIVVYDKDGNSIVATADSLLINDKVSFKYKDKSSVAIKDGDKYVLFDARYNSVKDLDEAEDFDAEQWWYKASVADRQTALDAIKDFKVGVEDAANATWEMFDNESRNAIEAAIKASGFVNEADEPEATKISEETWKTLSNPEKAELLDALKLDIANIAKDWSELPDDVKQPIVDSCKDESILDTAKAWGKKIKDAYDNFTDESAEDAPEVGNTIKVVDKDSVEHDATINAVDKDADGNITLTVTYGESASATAIMVDGKWTLQATPGIVAESVKDFDEVEVGEQVQTTLGMGKIVAKGTGLHDFAEATKLHKPNAGISMKELLKTFDNSFDVHWLIVDVAGKCFVDLYGKNNTFVNESAEAWNAATVEQRKQWLLAKNYLLADAEFNAAQNFENLSVETQNFVQEFFAIDESFNDTKIVDKCPVKLGNELIGFIEAGTEIEHEIIAGTEDGGLRINVWPKGKSSLAQTIVIGANDKEWIVESTELDSETAAWWNALSTEARKEVVGDTEEAFDMSFDELSDELKAKVDKAHEDSKLDESIVSDKVYQERLNDEQKALVDKYVNAEALTTNMKLLNANMSLSDKVAHVLADVINSQADKEVADSLKANQDALTEYLAAFWQDDMICEHKIAWTPRKNTKFVNEAEEDKVDAEDVNKIVDGLVDAGTLSRPQADELQDAIADSEELANIKTKGELASHVAKVADDLGYDVEVDDCMNMVNEAAEGEEVRTAILKDRAFNDFKFDCIEIDDKTMSVVMTNDGQLTGIAIEGPMTEAVSASLATLLKAYLESANADESLVAIKKRIKAIAIDESRLAKIYDAKGVAVIDESLLAPEQTPLWKSAMPAAYRLIVESLTDEQKQLLATQAAARTFVNEAEVAMFYRTRNWSQIKAYAGSGKPTFVNEGFQATMSKFTPEQQALIDAIKG